MPLKTRDRGVRVGHRRRARAARTRACAGSGRASSSSDARGSARCRTSGTSPKAACRVQPGADQRRAGGARGRARPRERRRAASAAVRARSASAARSRRRTPRGPPRSAGSSIAREHVARRPARAACARRSTSRSSSSIPTRERLAAAEGVLPWRSRSASAASRGDPPEHERRGEPAGVAAGGDPARRPRPHANTPRRRLRALVDRAARRASS